MCGKDAPRLLKTLVGQWHCHKETVLEARPHLEDMANSLHDEVAPFFSTLGTYVEWFPKSVHSKKSKLKFGVDTICNFLFVKNPTQNRISRRHFSIENKNNILHWNIKERDWFEVILHYWNEWKNMWKSFQI